MRQLRLDLRREAEFSRDRFVVSESNAAAVELLDRPDLWHGNVLVLVGPPGSGKTHLAEDWASRVGAERFDSSAGSNDLSGLAERPVMWDNADRPPRSDEALFHLINMAAAGGALLLTGRTAPSRWPAALPDLRSRLNALTVAELSEPDDAVLNGVLTKFFQERNIRPADDVLPYLVKRMERSVPVARDLVQRIDEAADAENRAVSRALARQVLDPTNGNEDEG